MTAGFTVMRTIRDGLRLRPGLEDVKVESHVLGTSTSDDQLVLAGFEGAEDESRLGRNREERFRIFGYVMASLGGSGEDFAIDAQDRVLDIYSELTTYIEENPTLGETVTSLKFTKFTGEQGIDNGLRWAGIKFDLEVWIA